ncbi:hypothetical protein LTR84_010280 [Exophiala bonariae]|uniref:Uncharacterized protein n=1 Tax=Exophiala bonariae TaxID=1690606 RepID=A0AAV9MWI5_9EURO|nr:hypothetical protein LTR84_010280 [Exophiala bonariae]
MTSLIFGSIYLGHKGIINHRREKQRQKNYQRWEGLRDEYDEQRKIGRESRSLDIQRTGADYDDDRPVLTLRDQQEANDARTSWRPQESFDGSASSQADRRTSVEVASGSGLRPLMQQNKTGSTWDDGLPQRLRVSRRNWDDYQPSNLSGNVSRSGSVREKSTTDTPARERSASKTPPSVNKQPSPQPDFSTQPTSYRPTDHRSVTSPAQMTHQPEVKAIEYSTPGGLMAELIESGNSSQPQSQPQHQQSHFHPHQQQTPFPQAYHHASYSHPQQTSYSPQPQQTPFSPQPLPQQTGAYGGFQPNSYGGTAPAPAQPSQPQNGGMQEWWNRPL